MKGAEEQEDAIGITVDNPSDLSDYEEVMSTYYSRGEVTAIITMKVDTKQADTIATSLSSLENMTDIYLVTGDTDIIAKAVFGSYSEIKDFLLSTLGSIEGIKEIKTMMVVTTFKEKGRVLAKE